MTALLLMKLNVSCCVIAFVTRSESDNQTQNPPPPTLQRDCSLILIVFINDQREYVPGH